MACGWDGKGCNTTAVGVLFTGLTGLILCDSRIEKRTIYIKYLKVLKYLGTYPGALVLPIP